MRGDTHETKNPRHVLASGGMLGLAFLVLGAGLVLVLAWFPWGIAVFLGGAAFAVPLAWYVLHDMAEVRSRFTYNVDRRVLAVERDDVAIAALVNDKASPLPESRVIPVNVSSSQRFVADDVVSERAAAAAEQYLADLFTFVDRSLMLGTLSRRALLPACPGSSTTKKREAYDEFVTVLDYFGFVAGRGDRVAGQLRGDRVDIEAAILDQWGVDNQEYVN